MAIDEPTKNSKQYGQVLILFCGVKPGRGGGRDWTRRWVLRYRKSRRSLGCEYIEPRPFDYDGLESKVVQLATTLLISPVVSKAKVLCFRDDFS